MAPSLFSVLMCTGRAAAVVGELDEGLPDEAIENFPLASYERSVIRALHAEMDAAGCVRQLGGGFVANCVPADQRGEQ